MRDAPPFETNIPAAGRRRLALRVPALGALAAMTGGAARFFARRISSRPASTAAGAAFAALLTGVALNALFFQKTRHPAPLFEAPPLASALPGPPLARPQPAVAPPAATAAPGIDSITGSTTASIPSGPPKGEQLRETDPEVTPRTRVTFERPEKAGRDPATVRHGKPATKAVNAKVAKAKGADRISQFLKTETAHRRRAKHEDE